MVGFHNRGGNKLDQFIAVKGDVATRATASGRQVTLQLQLLNLTPATGLPQYVQGPFPGTIGAAPGLYQAYAVFELPRFAGSIRLEVGKKKAKLVTAGPDGPSQVVATYVQIPRGTSLSVVATFTTPQSQRSLLFAPSARVPAIAWTAPGLAWSDDIARSVRW